MKCCPTYRYLGAVELFPISGVYHRWRLVRIFEVNRWSLVYELLGNERERSGHVGISWRVNIANGWEMPLFVGEGKSYKLLGHGSDTDSWLLSISWHSDGRNPRSDTFFFCGEIVIWLRIRKKVFQISDMCLEWFFKN